MARLNWLPNEGALAEAALSYARNGWPVVPLRDGRKEARAKGWQERTTGDNQRTRAEWREWPKANVGLVCGGEARLVVLDVDVKDGAGGEASLAALEAVYGVLPPTLEAETPSGGRHLVFRCPDELDLAAVPNSAREVGAGLDVRAGGGYVVVAPSRLEDGRAYRWVTRQEPAPLPEWLYQAMTLREPARPAAEPLPFDRPAERQEAPVVDKRLSRWVAKAVEGVALDVAKAAKGQRNVTLNRHAYRLGGLVGAGHLDEGEARRALFAGAYACQLTADDGESAVRKTVDGALAAGARAPWTPQLRESQRQRQRQSSSKASLPKPAEPVADAPAGWLEGLTQGRDGELKGTARNVQAVLNYDARLAGAVVFDERRMVPMVVRALPWDARAPRWLEDVDAVRLRVWLEEHYGMLASKELCLDALDAQARAVSVDPVRRWLEGLPRWDGTARCSEWLVRALGAVDTHYTREVGMRWLVSAVARAFEPGCKVDHELVLEGPQGIGKSSALRMLAGEADWFSDSLPSLSTKDAVEHLQGPWIVEMGELDQLSRSEVATAKAFLTKQSDQYRPSYGRAQVYRPRRCVFAGTTNDAHYLRDTTGSRRFWPVAVTGADLDWLRAHRDQLWSEAVALYRAGERWWLDAEAETLARAEQEARYQADPWEERVLAFIMGRSEVTTRAIREEALRIEDRHADAKVDKRIQAILRRAGWTTTGNPVRRGGLRVRVWNAPRGVADDEAPDELEELVEELPDDLLDGLAPDCQPEAESDRPQWRAEVRARWGTWRAESTLEETAREVRYAVSASRRESAVGLRVPSLAWDAEEDSARPQARQ